MSKVRIIVFCVFAVITMITAKAQIHTAPDSENDNWRYFKDIGIERGTFIPMSKFNLSSGNALTITGSYFYSDKWGFRSGVSFIDGLAGGANYWRVPILFAFRTRTFTADYDLNDMYEDYSFSGSLTRGLIGFFFSLLPTRFEMNAGASFGGISPYHSKGYSSNGSHITDISRTFASTLDANMRIGFQFWRICVNGNFGISYLLTQNINYYDIHPNLGEEKSNPSWLGNMGVGASFRF
ncbi:MAG: hypothetical protein LBI15_05600 [Dysgonamonadaceae bacterium]|jgi:hypothetical protein|nr:hypothetical protein [Dysgonamonadaceae bacterium]